MQTTGVKWVFSICHFFLLITLQRYSVFGPEIQMQGAANSVFIELYF